MEPVSTKVPTNIWIILQDLKISQNMRGVLPTFKLSGSFVRMRCTSRYKGNSDKGSNECFTIKGHYRLKRLTRYFFPLLYVANIMISVQLLLLHWRTRNDGTTYTDCHGNSFWKKMILIRLSSKLLKQGYLVECLRSSFRRFYSWYGDLIKQYEVSLSRILNDILTLDQQWLLNRSGFPPISWS